MNKKLKTTGISLALVGVIGLGATLAYLSDNTGPLTNTFTFTDKNIDITLDETDLSNPGERTEVGQDYKNLLSGQTVEKDPTVTVLKNSTNCNIFVSVTNPNEDEKLKITDLNETAWKFLNTEGNTSYYVYQGKFATGVKDKGDEYGVVPTSTEDQTLDAVFNHVKVGDNVDGTVKFDNIVIKAAAVQADHVDDATALQTALDLLK